MIIDRRRDRPASNRARAAVADWVVEQYLTRYFVLTPGVLKVSVRLGEHRRKHEGRPLPGTLLFQDASTHA